MKSLYSQMASTTEGSRALSAARLRYDILALLHRALAKARISQTELAARLGVRKSAVSQVFRGDGNLRVNTVAEYLDAMGYELDVAISNVGKKREDALRHMHATFVKGRSSNVTRDEDRPDLSGLTWNSIPSQTFEVRNISTAAGVFTESGGRGD
jgi:transcriptional regulator with XRE-family HTH domain